ncbi:hypothetical protein LMH87_001954 [Akanthomyces muscarius]|uniref:Uncharacterized protein n=1 Tax=Akanthomyces muscarius TaxID=2231603 RepID=A0A9W8Q5C4_AKAMU|nr:hypothetical protein LMH87_001954 [Akanthomyces muscarius]KAJ4147435.1 hypothetical protein LMH87_001954 [Akanthomyces muscarius]
MSDPGEIPPENTPSIVGVDQMMAYLHNVEDWKMARLQQIHLLVTEIRGGFNGKTEISTAREEAIKEWVGAVCRESRQYRLVEARRQRIGKRLLAQGREREVATMAGMRRVCLLASVMQRENTNAPKASHVSPQTSGADGQGEILLRCGICGPCLSVNQSAPNLISQGNVIPESRVGGPAQTDRDTAALVPSASEPASASKPEDGKSSAYAAWVWRFGE